MTARARAVRKTTTWLGVALAALLSVACGDGAAEREGATERNGRAQEPAAEGGAVITIAGEGANNHGTMDVSGMDRVTVTVDDLYFEPTLLRGEPEQEITVVLENTARSNLHNLTLLEQSVDQDVGPGQRVEVELAFPRSGAVAFFCGYHSSERMRGGLEVS